MRNMLLRHSWLFLLTISAFAKTNSSPFTECTQDNSHGLTLCVKQSKKLSLPISKTNQKNKASQNKKLRLFLDEFNFQLYAPPKDNELAALSNGKTKSSSSLYQSDLSNNMTFQFIPFFDPKDQVDNRYTQDNGHQQPLLTLLQFKFW